MLEALKNLFNKANVFVQSAFGRAKDFVQPVAYNLYDLPTTVYDYFFTDFGDAKLRKALHKPVVGVKHGDKTARMINPDINPEKYIFNMTSEFSTENLAFSAITPRLILRSIPTDATSAEYKEDLQNLIALRKDPRVMAKYAFGGTSTAEVTTKRFEQLSDRLRNGNPYSAMMAYYTAPNTKERIFVGMFTLGMGEQTAEAEYAAIINPRVWNKGFLTEAALLLFKVPAALKNFGYKITQNGTESELATVSGTARLDNFSEPTLRSLLFTPREVNTKRYGDGEQARNVFRNDVQTLGGIWKNSETYAKTPVGTIVDLERPSNQVPRLTA